MNWRSGHAQRLPYRRISPEGDRFEVLARSVRDLLSRRWHLIERIRNVQVAQCQGRVDDGLRADNHAVSAANPKAAQ